MMRRVRHAILILVGRGPSLERLEFIMALERTAAAVANLKAAATALINHCQDHSAEIASLNQQLVDVDNADASISADIQATADQINAAIPASGTQPA